MPKGCPKNPVPDEVKFWRKVHKPGPKECWPWLGGRDRYGYGTHKMQNKAIKAHRAAYLLTHGSLPKDLCVCHRCDNPPCVNPAHLFLATNAENTFDRVRKKRSARNAGPLNGMWGKTPVVYKPDPSKVLRGSKNGAAKLTEEQVTDILVRRARGEKLLDIAQLYSISFQYVSQLYNNPDCWAHVKNDNAKYQTSRTATGEGG